MGGVLRCARGGAGGYSKRLLNGACVRARPPCTHTSCVCVCACVCACVCVCVAQSGVIDEADKVKKRYNNQ